MPTRPPVHRAPWLRPRADYERERRERADAKRPPSSQRGYDREWRALRARFIADHPTCSTPLCGQPATDVDHVADVRRYPHLRLVEANLRAFCHPCHSRRTATEQGFARRK